LGAFLANFMAHEPVVTAAGIAIGNTLEALIGVWLYRHFVGEGPPLERLRDIFAFIVSAAGAGTLVSAVIWATSLCLGVLHRGAAFWGLWSVWWLGDVAGALVFARVLLAWSVPPRIRWEPHRVAEAVLLLAGLVVLCSFVFTERVITDVTDRALVY